MTFLNFDSLNTSPQAMEYILNNIAFVSLLIMTIWHWARLIYSLQFPPAAIGTVGIAISNLSLSSLLVIRWVESGHFPLSNLYESLLFLAWGFTTFHLLVEQLTKVQFVGVVTAPVALLITGFAGFSLPKEMQRATALIPALQSNWLMMHVTIMMMSYVALLGGSLLAIAFLVVNWYTQQKNSCSLSLQSDGPSSMSLMMTEPSVTDGTPSSHILQSNMTTLMISALKS
jgi:cytochrome c-type biogenesis protein CcsB